jgi:hypothetical protein
MTKKTYWRKQQKIFKSWEGDGHPVEETMRTPNRQDILYQVILQLKILSAQNKEKISIATREKHQLTYKGTSNW